MSDAIVQIAPDSTGKDIDMSALTVGANTVYRQRINVADPTAAAGIAAVTNTTPGSSNYGMVVRPITAVGQGTMANSGSMAIASDQTAVPVTLSTLIAGEDLTNNVTRVEEHFSYNNIATATTTVVKSGQGFLHSITFNKPVISEVWTLYDNTTGSGTKIGTITLPSALLAQGPYTARYDVAFTTGLTIVSTSTTDGTVSFR
jgi:hypothetical protein